MKISITSIIVALLLLVVVMVWGFSLLPDGSVKSFIKDNQVLVILTVIGTFLLSIASNILSFFLSDFLFQRDMSKKQSDAFDSIREIKQNLDETSIVLEATDRKTLHPTGPTAFYNNLYNNATDIRISGSKTTELIKNIVKSKKEGDNWVKRLEQRKHVTVRILMVSPKSKQIPDWEVWDGLQPGSMKQEIESNFEKLKIFTQQNSEKKLTDSTSISIQVIDDIQYFNITYAGNTDTRTDTLLFSISFNKDRGPMYKIINTNGVTTHADCLAYFDRLYEKGRKIFHWDSNGPTYYDEDNDENAT